MVFRWRIFFKVLTNCLNPLFGSIVAFGCYMLLIGRIGADHAAYAMLLVPVLALILSTLFEDYHWYLSGVAGVIMVIMGNLVLMKKSWTPLRTLRRTM